MENKLEALERAIHAMSIVYGISTEELWRRWHSLEQLNNWDFEKNLIDFFMGFFIPRAFEK